jgi:glycosyltransferase involved in cell wall biosynthesis
MRRPPVLHVIPFLWSGAGGVVTRLCEAQREHGPVTVVTTGRSGELSDWPAYRRRLRRAGVTHHAIDFFDRSAARFWSSVSELAALIRDLRPVVIHAHAGVPACGVTVARATSGHRARVIGQMYSWGPDRPEWMNRQDTWGLGQCDRVVCSAHAYRDLLVHYGVPARKLLYLPWGLPLERLPYRGESGSKARHAPGAQPGGGPVIGFVGRIEPRKGQLELVQALAGLRKKHPTARLELVGPVADAAYFRAIQETVKRRGLDDAVVVTGEVRDVTARLRRWDLFVSLSSDEGQGLAVLEAMAVGVPVLAMPVSGIADFLAHRRTGFALARRDPKSVAAAALGVLAEPAASASVARKARRLVERRYGWDLTVRAFDRLYWD